eukprot:PhF_6_TR40594/c0_g1_i1/m.60888
MNRQEWCHRIMNYFKIHDPPLSNITNVEQLLQQCDSKGIEYPMIWSELVKKYGPESTASRKTWHGRVFMFLKHRYPHKATDKEVERILNEAMDKPGGWDAMWEDLMARHVLSPEVLLTRSQWVDRIYRLLVHRCPEKADIPLVEKILNSVDELDWGRMFTILQQSHGTEPVGWDPFRGLVEKTNAPPPGVEVGSKLWWRYRIVNYYSCIVPAHQKELAVDDILAKFEKVGFENLWEMLILKHGQPPLSDYFLFEKFIPLLDQSQTE